MLPISISVSDWMWVRKKLFNASGTLRLRHNNPSGGSSSLRERIYAQNDVKCSDAALYALSPAALSLSCESGSSLANRTLLLLFHSAKA